MQLVATATDYQVEISVDDMLALLKLEGFGSKSDVEPLFRKLNEIDGVDNADYDGHFGAQVFLSIEIESDTPETKAKIIQAIEQHLQIARDFSKA